MKRTRFQRREQASTLVEVLVIIGILGVLVSLLLCGVQQVRASASRAACENHLRQVVIALHSYHDQHQGFPIRDSVTFPLTTLSWMGFLLPHIEQESLWNVTVQAFKIERFAFHDPPHVGFRTAIPIYICPADGRLRQPLQDSSGVHAAFTSYLGITGGTTRDGVFGRHPGVSLSEITDGTSQTVMISERPPPTTLQAGRWYTASSNITLGAFRGPEGAMTVRQAAFLFDSQCVGPIYGFRYGRLDNPCDRYHFWSLHPGGANFAFADGSVRFLAYSADAVLPALATRAGGEVVSLD